MLKRNLLPLSILATALILLVGIYTLGIQENATLSSVFNIVGAEECEGDACQQQQQSQNEDEFVWWDLGFDQQQQQSQSQDGQQQQQQQDGDGQQQQQQQQDGDGQQQQQQQNGDGQQQQQQQQQQDQDQDPVCDDPNPGRDLVSSAISLVDRTARATVTNNSDACTYNIGMASYKKFDEVIDNQELFDSVTTSIAPDSNKLLTVDYPECAAQIDVFYGELLTDLVGKRYGDRLLKAIHTTDPYCQKPEEPSDPEVTIVAKKVVCDAESDLPNWASGTQNIEVDSTTAQDYVDASNGACRIVNFSFQWAKGGTPNPGDNTGSAGSPWTTFTSSAVVPLSALGTADRIWVREVYENKYIPFTGQNTTQMNSAEMICHTDSINFDNYDYISNPVDGETYYCVAFNVLKTPDQCVLPTVEISRVSGDTSGKVGETFTHTFSVEVTGDDTPTIEVVNLPAGLTYSTSTKTISGTPTAEGTFKIKATADNSCGTDTAEVSIIIAPKDTNGGGGPTALSGQCAVDKSSVAISETVTFTATPTGGTGSYTYTWTGDNVSATSSSVTTSYDSAGTKNATVTITSGDETISDDCSVTVEVDGQGGDNGGGGSSGGGGGGGSSNRDLRLACEVSPIDPKVGSVVTWTADAEYGRGDYTYFWTGTDGLSGNTEAISKIYTTGGVKVASVVVESRNGDIETVVCTVTIPEPQVLGVVLSDVPYTGFSDNIKVLAFMVGLLTWSSAIGYFILRRFTRPTFAVDGHTTDEGEEEVSRIIYHNSPTYHEELYNRINGITPEDTEVKRFTDLLKF